MPDNKKQREGRDNDEANVNLKPKGEKRRYRIDDESLVLASRVDGNLPSGDGADMADLGTKFAMLLRAKAPSLESALATLDIAKFLVEHSDWKEEG